MRLREFIRENRTELERFIIAAMGYTEGEKKPKLNRDEIEEWILNDEGLYHWAKLSKVKI